ncbi:MAG: hypothetical protein ACTHMC_08610 [Pseudobacter sp.]|uniref:hypothetical protein n=1 Tax=Pseudobacter sp. TaxID=2045420 RepID=UPI003F7D1DBA
MKSSLLYAMIIVIFISCKKDQPPIQREQAVYPRTEAEKELAGLHTEFARILRGVYQSREAFREVQAAIWSGYYQDERVLLKALLHPHTSPLYQLAAFKNFRTGSGFFKKQFDSCLAAGDFPRLQKHLSKTNPVATTAGNVNFEPEESSDELSIYFPYSDNYKPAFEQEQEEWLRATLVAADRDADEAPGLEPVAGCTGVNCYLAVTVNDEYCEQNVVHIAQSGGTRASLDPVNPQPVINMVMLGSVRCTSQYDHLISFTGNGGGSELRFVRADGYLQQNANGQITSPQNLVTVNISRKDIRKKRWVDVNAIWDSNWETDNPEQVFAIYEEDNEGSRTISGSIQAKLLSLTIEPIGYSITVKTKDEIIRQLGWKRNSFFAFNRGGLNNGCGLLNGFTIYDCNSPVSYNLPVQK